MDVSGVRNSCEASARKRRSFSPMAARSAKARSICSSIALRARPSRPTSVFGSAGATRCVGRRRRCARPRRPCPSRGRRSRMISTRQAAPRPASTSTGHDELDGSSRPSVDMASLSGIATTSTRRRPAAGCTSTRKLHRRTPPAAPVVNVARRSRRPAAGERAGPAPPAPARCRRRSCLQHAAAGGAELAVGAVGQQGAAAGAAVVAGGEGEGYGPLRPARSCWSTR